MREQKGKVGRKGAKFPELVKESQKGPNAKENALFVNYFYLFLQQLPGVKTESSKISSHNEQDSIFQFKAANGFANFR